MLNVVAIPAWLRQGELLALTWDDVNLDDDMLRVTHPALEGDGRLRRMALNTELSEHELTLSP